ncbi:hypothetical protein ACFL6D_02540 [Spirochaetota bacterium]
MKEISDNFGQSNIDHMPIDGIPMIEHTIERSLSVEQIDQFIAVGNTSTIEKLSNKYNERITTVIEDTPDPIDRLYAGTLHLEHIENIMIIPSNSPFCEAGDLQKALELIKKIEHFDMITLLISKDIFKKHFPDKKKVFLNLNKSKYAGISVVFIKTRFLLNKQKAAGKVFRLRNSPLELLHLLGFKKIIKFILKSLTIDDIEDSFIQKYACLNKIAVVDTISLAADIVCEDDIALAASFLNSD